MIKLQYKGLCLVHVEKVAQCMCPNFLIFDLFGQFFLKHNVIKTVEILIDV